MPEFRVKGYVVGTNFVEMFIQAETVEEAEEEFYDEAESSLSNFWDIDDTKIESVEKLVENEQRGNNV